MSVAIVDTLEVINVTQHQGEFSSVPTRFGELRSESLVEVRAVPQCGETVELRPLREHAHKLLNANCGTHSCLQLSHFKWFLDIVNRTEIETTHAIHGLTIRADEYYRDVASHWIFFERLQDFETVHVRKFNVEQDDFGAQLARHAQSILAGAGTMNLHLLQLQSCAQESVHQL